MATSHAAASGRMANGPPISRLGRLPPMVFHPISTHEIGFGGCICSNQVPRMTPATPPPDGEEKHRGVLSTVSAVFGLSPRAQQRRKPSRRHLLITHVPASRGPRPPLRIRRPGFLPRRCNTTAGSAFGSSRPRCGAGTWLLKTLNLIALKASHPPSASPHLGIVRTRLPLGPCPPCFTSLGQRSPSSARSSRSPSPLSMARHVLRPAPRPRRR
jgi:hypothetical protein